MKKMMLFVTLIFSVTLLQFCKHTKAATSTATAMGKDLPVSYKADVAPILLGSCSPCHYPEKGRSKQLDSYQAVKDNFDEILTRVKLPATDSHFMPFRSMKPALSDSAISVFTHWKSQNMAE